MRTNVYVDGFNLYYGALKNAPYKWLDLAKLCNVLLPRDTIHRIRYFTAIVSARDDPDKPVRQQIYLRALKTIPNLSIHLGQFVEHVVMMPVADKNGGRRRYERVLRTDEKGSDVNLATHLLHDAFRNDFECAVVVSNDSDLAEPIRLIRSEFKKTVGILNPHRQYTSVTLRKVATFVKQVRPITLSLSQFPPKMKDDVGDFEKPKGW